MSCNSFVSFNMQDKITGFWNEIGKTENLKNQSNPNYKTTFTIEYEPNLQQNCQIVVFDQKVNGQVIYIGECQTTINQVINSKNATLILEIFDTNQKNCSNAKVILIAETIHNCNIINEIYSFQWSGVQLMNTDGWFDKSDPFLRFIKVRQDNTKLIVHETEVVMDNLNPIWKDFQIANTKLNYGNNSHSIRGECWDWEKSDKHQYIGEFYFSIDEIWNGKREFVLYNPKQKNPGKIKLLKFEQIFKNSLDISNSFLNFIKQNVELKILFAIDFSLIQNDHQNQQIQNSNSILNYYKQYIKQIWQIFFDSDFNKKISYCGFYDESKQKMEKYQNIKDQLLSKIELKDSDNLQEILNFINDITKNESINKFSTLANIAQQTQKTIQNYEKENKLAYTYIIVLTWQNIEDIQESFYQAFQNRNLPLSPIFIDLQRNDFNNPTYNYKNDKQQGDTYSISKSFQLNQNQQQQNQIQQYFYEDALYQIIQHLSKKGINKNNIPVISMSQIVFE